MSTTTKPFETYSVMDFWRPWFGQAPGALVQPILPGWTLNINSNNSSAPQTEANVVAKHSYGRQIGRISDALRALILEQHPNPPETGPFAQFISMWEEIEQIKSESATARLEQIASDLALLKDKDLPEYTRLRDALRPAPSTMIFMELQCPGESPEPTIGEPQTSPIPNPEPGYVRSK